MARLTRIYRHGGGPQSRHFAIGVPGKGLPKEYARSMSMSELPGSTGSRTRRVEGRVQILEGWQYSPVTVRRDVVLASGLKPRLCYLAR